MSKNTNINPFDDGVEFDPDAYELTQEEKDYLDEFEDIDEYFENELDFSMYKTI